jgi:peptidyl-prolyl cis-trans isomerase A (cyclophilin A)
MTQSIFNRREFLLLSLAAGCSSAQALTTPENVLAKPEIQTQPDDVFLVDLKTSQGPVVIEVHPDWAPLGAKRFKELVEAEFFDECRFFRIVPDFVVQFGMNGDPLVNARWKDRKFRDDPVIQSNKAGYVTFATSGTNSRTTQLFINLKHNDALDRMGFAPFGKVVEGMEIVRRLESKYGEEPDQGMVSTKGNDYLKAYYPDLDYVETLRMRSNGSVDRVASGEDAD